MKVILQSGHPYFDECGVQIRSVGDKWGVRWRDYTTERQERDFDSEDEARLFAGQIASPPLEVEIEDWHFEHLQDYWRRAAERRALGA